ncbi:hypothetical protein ACMZ5A_29395, partial [Bacillus mobilis]
MQTRSRTLTAVAAALALGLTAGPLAAPAFASPAGSATTAHATTGPDAEALRAALAGLPDSDATAALVRVGGSDGTW